MTPNMISIVSLWVAFLGFVFILIGGEWGLILGIFCLMFWAVLDCADGTLARTLFYKYNLQNPLGEFFDAFAGYGVVAFLWLSIGWSSYQDIGDVRVFFVGAFSSILGLFARVSYSKLALVKMKNQLGIEEDSRKSFLYFIYENIEFGSALFPLLLFGIFFNVLLYIILLYFLINISMVFWFFRIVFLESRKIGGK
jgi:phosphatidylglycerophosphate synthase